MPGKNPDHPKLFQLKATVRYIQPPIWRQLLVSSDTTLETLHDILQIIFGWDDSHLHVFKVAGNEYSNPDFELDVEDESLAELRQLITRAKQKMLYEYDFGDSWEVEIVVEKILPFDETQALPFVTEGERAGPLEDSGGVWRYMALVDILKDPSHPEYEERAMWVYGDEVPDEGDAFDAEAFDREAMNARLRTLR
jgi:hypothetical protein